MKVALVALAGASGVLVRYAVGQVSSSIWATLAVNVAGCLLLGVLLEVGRDWPAEARDALGAGFLGGLTTFSTFAAQGVLEGDAGRLGTAALYVAASVLLGLAAAAAGLHGARALG